MGKLLMIQEEDERRIESLKQRLGIQRKVDVLRAGIDLLEKQAERSERVLRWKRAAAVGSDAQRESKLTRSGLRLLNSAAATCSA